MKCNDLRKPLFMLVIRSMFFLLFQALIAMIFYFKGSSEPWNTSSAWWPLVIILTDVVCLSFLIHFYKEEEKSFWAVFRIERQFMKGDLLFMLGFLFFGGLLGYLPNILSAWCIFGDPQVALDMVVRPLPVWAAITGVALFPLMQGLVEIPTYMLYALPRIEAVGIRPWKAVGLASFWLSAQHVFAPFLLDGRFVVYRLMMFLPFALLVAMVMRARPRLMPYMAVMHVLMDISLAIMFLPVMY